MNDFADENGTFVASSQGYNTRRGDNEAEGIYHLDEDVI